ncbi:MAG: glycosyltransferase family 2 protein [Nitrospirae bacterium]|nr:glycosyltransferase family 2 protein [Nitrospirota bacterium]
MHDFVIIIPAYNEAGRLRHTIRGIQAVADAPIVVVNDGSLDGTAQEARDTGATVLDLPFNLGYGAALQTGYRYALKEGYVRAVQMDADGQHDPVSIPILLKDVQTGTVDVVIGSRFLGESDYRPPLIRKIGMVLFRNIASFLTGQKITDPTSGFQALNLRAMQFYASDAYPVDFPDADVLIMLHRSGMRFKEVPVRMHQSPKKISMHSGIVPLYYLFKMVLSIFVTLLREKYPQEEA